MVVLLVIIICMYIEAAGYFVYSRALLHCVATPLSPYGGIALVYIFAPPLVQITSLIIADPASPLRKLARIVAVVV
jgi:hypothetical protein